MRIIRVVTSSALMGVISSRDFIDVVKTVKNDDFISTNGEDINLSVFSSYMFKIREINVV